MSYHIVDYIRDKSPLQTAKFARLLTITILLLITVLLNTVINSTFIHCLDATLVLLFFLVICTGDPDPDFDDEPEEEAEEETDLPSDHTD